MKQDIAFYVDKFLRKMNGSSFATMEGWVEGIGKLTREDIHLVKKGILNHPDAKITELPDELNPQFIFSQANSILLSAIVTGAIDVKELAWQELRNRGLDADGSWVGFEGYITKEPAKPFKSKKVNK